MLFVACDEKGQIGCFRNIPEEDKEIIAFYRETERLVPSSNAEVSHETHYVAPSDTITERPTMPLSISGAAITGIPAGSALTLGEQEYQVDDGEAEIAGYAGPVKITCWPYIDAEVTV